MNLPTGTLTFLFTDIEGSTGLWEEKPDAMQTALARHDTLLQEAIESHDGYVFKTMGDAICAAFATAPDAVMAAVGAQRALLLQEWEEGLKLSVRMALYTGAAELRNNDYFGQPLNRLARLLKIGHGGQVLISEGTSALVRDFLPPGATLRDLNAQRLRDLSRPEHVYQLDHPDLPSDFPRLQSLDNPNLSHNLPEQVTSFIGRDAELAETKSLFSKTRLLTLTGAGGAGKSRLSLHLAADLLRKETDGAWLVELAPITDAALVPQIVAQVLEVHEEAGKTILESVTEHLKKKQMLLILDNCEHLLSACAHLAETLLRHCPRLKILASSREPLDIQGETTYRVPSLSFPDPAFQPLLASLDQYEAVRLFVDRAVAVLSAFTVTNENAPAIAHICHRLDGIPLAIELAAARVRSLSVQEINERLEDRFRLLTGGSRTALPRQKTLRALIDWSYDLLDDREKLLLRCLSVFVGGWTVLAAEQVCSGDALDAYDVLDVLMALVNKSLVVTEVKDCKTRYRLLETVRQYSLEKLRTEHESRGEGLFRRHCEHFLAFAEQAEPHLRAEEQLEWLDVLDVENDNLRAAQDWALEFYPEAALRIAGALWWFWFLRGYWTEGRQRPLAVLSKAAVSEFTAARVQALNGVSLCTYGLGDYGALQGPATEALRLARGLDDPWLLSFALQMSAVEAVCSFDLERAGAVGADCLALARALGEQWLLSWALFISGNLQMAFGDFEGAYRLFTEGLRPAKAAGDRWVIGYLEGHLAELELLRGEDKQAEEHFTTCLLLVRDLGQPAGIILGLQGLAGVAGVRGQCVRAARLLGAVEALREAFHYPLEARAQPSYDFKLAGARCGLDEEAFGVAWAEGRAMSLEQAVNYGLDQHTEDI